MASDFLTTVKVKGQLSNTFEILSQEYFQQKFCLSDLKPKCGSVMKALQPC